jgi:hypothetical protein
MNTNQAKRPDMVPSPRAFTPVELLVMHLHRAVVLCPVFAMAAFAAGNERDATGYEISGIASITFARGPSTRPAEVSCAFRVNWEHCNWIIRTRRSDQAHDYDEVGYDGTYVYSVASMEEWAKQRREKGLPVGTNIGEGEVIPGMIPFRAPEEIRVLWLLYASGCVLDATPPNRLPAIVTHSSRHAYLYAPDQPAIWTRSSGLPGLLSSAALLSDGRILRWKDADAGYMAGAPEESMWFSPFKHGFTNAVLSVTAFYREQEHVLPKSAEFQVYAPKPGGTSTSQLDLLRSYSIRATNIVLQSALSEFKPRIDGRVVVNDRRFEREETPVYEVVYRFNSNWLSDDEVRDTPEFKKSIPAQRLRINVSRSSAEASVPSVSKNIRYAVLILMIVSLLVMVFAVIIVTRNQRNAQKR